MRVEITNETTWRVPTSRLHTVARRAEQHLGLPPAAHVHLVFVADRAMQRLNRRAFRRNRPTDVLAFPLHTLRPTHPNALRTMPKDPDGFIRLGDVVISVPTAVKQAENHGHPPADEVLKLFAHGVLHLLGYDHARRADAARMERLTKRLLG